MLKSRCTSDAGDDGGSNCRASCGGMNGSIYDVSCSLMVKNWVVVKMGGKNGNNEECYDGVGKSGVAHDGGNDDVDGDNC